MKKIVGIIAALALVGSVFARPDITPTITEFGGSAKLEWIANLDPDPITMGFKNTVDTRWVIQFCADDYGGEGNSGDGLWGEISLKTEGGKKMMGPNYGGAYENNAWTIQTLKVGTAKLHFIDGDTYFNMDILAPGFTVGEIEGTLAIDRDGADYNGTIFAGVTPSAWVDDVEAAVAATKPVYGVKDDGTWGVVTPATAEKAAVIKGKKFKAISDYQGFTLNFGVPIVDLTFAFGDDGVKDVNSKNYAFKLNAIFKPVDGLKLSAGFAYGTADGVKDNAAIAFSAAYKYSIDDKLYLQPFTNFTMLGKAMDVNAALLFGWGAGPSNYNHPFIAFKNSNISPCDDGWKAADGISVAFKKSLSDGAGKSIDAATLWIDFYDSSLLAEFVPGLKLAARYAADSKTDLGKGNVAFGLIYDNTFDPIYITAKTSFGLDLAKTEKNSALAYSLQVGTKSIVANTDLYLNYAASISEYSNVVDGKTVAEDNNKKGTITIGAKITF